MLGYWSDFRIPSSRKTPVEIQIHSVEIETVVKPAEGTPSNFVRDKYVYGFSAN